MDQQSKDDIVARAMAKRTTYHGKDGKLSSAASATTATRGGERLKVVRQLRRMTRGPKKESVNNGLRAVLRSNLAKAKASLTGALSAPGWVNVHDAFEE
jgi:hypothetical protein